MPPPEPTSVSQPGESTLLFGDRFDGPDRLVTNEYAYWNPGASDRVVSPDWEMDSGSFFIAGGTGWTGIPDGASPDAASALRTGSAVFRLASRRRDFGDVAVRSRVRLDRFVTTSRTPATDWDGLHLWLRYQDQHELYYASPIRRDGHVVIKKKCRGGHTNGGTYYTLAETSGRAVQPGVWTDVEARVMGEPDGAVRITLLVNGAEALTALDRGTGCAPLPPVGGVGLRGDNAELHVADFEVASLSG